MKQIFRDVFNQFGLAVFGISLVAVSYFVFQDKGNLTERVIVAEAIASLDSSIVNQQNELKYLLNSVPPDTAKITQLNNSIFYSAGQRDLLKVIVVDEILIRKP